MKPDTKKPSHDVLVASNLNKRNREENDHLRRVGAAWAHEDGKGFTIQLFAQPLDGRLVLREPLPPKEDEAPPQREQSYGNGYGQQSRGR